MKKKSFEASDNFPSWVTSPLDLLNEVFGLEAFSYRGTVFGATVILN